MAELFVKTVYAVVKSKVVLHYSAVKGFHIYDIRSLISVHSNCIDSIYTNVGDLVVRYLQRTLGFESQVGLELSTINQSINQSINQNLSTSKEMNTTNSSI